MAGGWNPSVQGSVIRGRVVAPFGLIAEFRALLRITPGRDAEPARPRPGRRDNSLPGGRPRGSRRADKAGAPAALPSSTSRKTARAPSPASRRRCRSSNLRASPLPRREAATATDRISASLERPRRDMMNPTSPRPTMARCATTLRSSSRCSNSPSLQPRWNEAACSAGDARGRRAAWLPTARARCARTGG